MKLLERDTTQDSVHQLCTLSPSVLQHFYGNDSGNPALDACGLCVIVGGLTARGCD